MLRALSLVPLLAVAVFAYSNGEFTTCDVDDENLHVRHMPWTHKPVFSQDYSVRTGDIHPSVDPTTYTGDEWMNIHVRALRLDRKYCGLLMYAEDARGRKVGEWWIPEEGPRKFWNPTLCPNVVHHAGAEEKRYHHVFKLKVPVGTGPITIKALVKQGPTNTGEFYFPNQKHLVINEETAPPARRWFKTAAGESCAASCAARGLECDVEGLAKANSPAELRFAVEPYYECRWPVFSGCSEDSPNSVTQAGHRDDTCSFHEQNCAATGRLQGEASCDAATVGVERFCACKAAGTTPYTGMPAAPMEVVEEEPEIQTGESSGFNMIILIAIGGGVAFIIIVAGVGFGVSKMIGGGSSGSSPSGYGQPAVAEKEVHDDDLW